MTVPDKRPLDPVRVSLTGVKLIEASAGTGKTYAITELYARLILEKRQNVDRILVVTFTEAATEELRSRIRIRLTKLLAALQNWQITDDALVQVYRENIRKTEETLHQDINHVTNAIRGFDEASIFTIHSFCRRILQDNAFESGTLFGAELIKDQSPLLQAITEDFWRQQLYHASPLFISYLGSQYKTPAALRDSIKSGIGQTTLKILPYIAEPPVTTAIEQKYQQLFTETAQQWRAQQEIIREILLNSPALNRQIYAKNSIPKWCQALDTFFMQEYISLSLPEKFENLTSKKITEKTKKGQLPPEHPFFIQAEVLYNCAIALRGEFRIRLLWMKQQLLKTLHERLAVLKYQQNILSFDDLLNNLRAALLGGNGEQLAKSVRRRYPNALIDEFQDTDAVQYDIFRAIYGAAEETLLFLIGDPKQAIYSFRGADIYTYMQAAINAVEQYTLDTNWRSEPKLIQAVNTLFQQRDDAFLLDKIRFYPVKPKPQAAQENSVLLNVEHDSSAPLQLWFLARDQAKCQKELITKESANSKLCIAVAGEIARLLNLASNGLARIGNQPLKPGDIAVLVRKNYQAQALQQQFRRCGIPGVLYSTESLFDSEEMQAVERILLAVAEPGREELIRSALATDLLGLDGQTIYQLSENDREWQKYLQRFHNYHLIWQQQGFIQMFRTFLTQESVARRLLAFDNGERRLTNVLHLMEVLQRAVAEHKPGITGLCLWLSRQRGEQTQQNDEEKQLRLESDEARVKLVTVHKSKGLEYPLVFCPFLWDGSSQLNAKNPFTFHDETQQRVLDLGSEDADEHYEHAKTEEKAENLRLLYVALTRARHRCYTLWGAFNDAEHSPLGHLLHPQRTTEIREISDADLLADLQALSEKSAGTIAVNALPMEMTRWQQPPVAEQVLAPRQFRAQIPKNWRVYSYTGLLRRSQEVLPDRPDHDEDSAAITEAVAMLPVTDGDSILTFPRGSKAGQCLHDIFERIDFSQTTHHATQVDNQLRKYGYDAERWKTVIFNMLDDVLSRPLGNMAGVPFALSAISFPDRLSELEFYYPLSECSVLSLQHIFLEHGATDIAESLSRLTLKTLQGFMKGYVDLIFRHNGRFYLVDYKSSHLGGQPSAYHSSRLHEVMSRDMYLLQYHIYLIALHRYLQVRLKNYTYQTHIGGVYYLFLRGMQAEWGEGCGIYHALPSGALIEALSGFLGGAE